MPLLGTLEKGTMTTLLDSMQESQTDAILKIETPQYNGEIYVESGKIVRIQHEHSNLQELLQELLRSEQGTFLIHRPDDHISPTSIAQLPIWLLDDNQERRKDLQQLLQQLKISSATILDATHIKTLLRHQHPKVLLLGDLNILHDQEELFESIIRTHRDYTIILIGQPFVLPEEITPAITNWLQWPVTRGELAVFLKKWIPLPESEILPNSPESLLPSGVLQFMSNFTPKLDTELYLEVNPNHLNSLRQAKLPIKWFNWITSIQPTHPIHYWLSHFPGSPDLSEMIVSYLIQVQILQATTKRSIVMGRIIEETEKTPRTPSAYNISHEEISQLANKQDSSDTFILLKVIVFGLRGEKRAEWLNSLQKISQTQSAKISREHSTHIPYLPKAELARIPLKSDSLLVVYSALTENSVDELIDQIGINLTSFLFFLDVSNQHELLYIRNLRKKLLERYHLPDLVMVSGTKGATREVIEQQLGLGSLWHPIDQFDVQTSYKLLRILLLRTASPNRKKM